MQKKIKSALISVFYKDGLEEIVQQLHHLDITIYSTGGTQQFIEALGVPCIPVESLTTYPSILGGRVKTLHPAVFGGILARRDNDTDIREMNEYRIPAIDLVIVDLYPFEENLAQVSATHQGSHEEAEKMIIEKIDIGGPSMIRAAAKNFKDVLVVASKNDYPLLERILKENHASTGMEERRKFAAKAFDICSGYDIAISNYFNNTNHFNPFGADSSVLRYGENPHQQALFYGKTEELFEQLNGKELSYNNLVDVDAAMQLIKEFDEVTFAIIKHTNVCGIAARSTLKDSWDVALAGDPESAFGGVLACNAEVDRQTAEAIHEIFFEVLLAPSFSEEALAVLRLKKNRILLQSKSRKISYADTNQFKSLLNGVLSQQTDTGNFSKWEEAGGRQSTDQERSDLVFANIVCKHLKSNAIALVKNKQLVGKGCGQTSRIDALRQAIEKAKQFNFDLKQAVMASDAFFPFNDCVKMGHEAGIEAFIQPGGSVRDADSFEYCRNNNLVMVMTGMRHFRH